MKKPLLIILFLSFAFIVKAQNPKKDSIFLVVDQPPTFKDGDFSTYLAKNIRYPANAAVKDIHGKVFVQFIIRKNGTLTDATIIRSVSPEIDAEALRVVSGSPNWFPGVQNGQPVSVKYNIPIMFNISPPNVVDSSAAKAQDTTSDEDLLSQTDPAAKLNSPVNNQIFAAVQYEPTFPGGNQKLQEYIVENLKQPAGEKANKGSVMITFVVEKDGSLTSVQVDRYFNKLAASKRASKEDEEEAIRVMKNCPKWNPGIQNGKAVRVQYTIPVKFGNN